MNPFESTADLVEFLRTFIPEKQLDFDSLVASLRITILWDEATDAKVFKACSATKQILVGQKGVERLWAHAYAYASLWLGVRWKIANGDIPFHPRGDAILEEASQLLTWAVRTDIALKDDPKAVVEPNPVGLPSPFDGCEDGTVQAVAQTLWCHALCFVLFHELEHVRLGHFRLEGTANIEQEKEADREAARWLLEDPEGNQRRQLERCFGVVTALIYLAVTDVYLPGAHGDDYPPGYDRLFQTLSQYFYDHDEVPSEQVWAFVSICVMLHIHNKQLAVETNTFTGSWRQIADNLVNILATRSAI